MVTGDHSETAKSIALKIGLTDDSNEKVIHGKDLKSVELLSEDELKQLLNTINFSRVSPAQKFDLVSLYQQ